MRKRTAPTTSEATIKQLPVRWLTTKRACEYLGVSRDFLESLKKQAGLSFYKVGQTVFFNVEDIDKLIIKNKVI